MAYYSKVQKYKFVQQYRNSNMTASQFCKENGLNLHTFKYWAYSEGWKYEPQQMQEFIELGKSEIETDGDKTLVIRKAEIEIRVPAEIAERNLIKILDAVAAI